MSVEEVECVFQIQAPRQKKSISISVSFRKHSGVDYKATRLGEQTLTTHKKS